MDAESHSGTCLSSLAEFGVQAVCETVDQVSQHSQVLVDSGSQSELSVVDNSAQTDNRGVFVQVAERTPLVALGPPGQASMTFWPGPKTTQSGASAPQVSQEPLVKTAPSRTAAPGTTADNAHVSQVATQDSQDSTQDGPVRQPPLLDLTQDLQGQIPIGPLSKSANPKFKGTPYVPPPPPKPLQDPGSSGAVARPQREGWSPYDYPIVRDFTALARLEGRQAPLGSMEKFRQIAKDLDMAPPGVAGSLVCQHKGYMYAPLDLVGYEGQLPAGSKESQVFLRLRPHRHRALPPKLRNKGFSLAGYCLEPCVFHRLCATACSRTVCVEAKATHDRHVCQGCEEQGVPSRPQWPPGSPGYVA